MYNSHQFIRSPQNQQQKIWRYINTDKLLNLLDSQCLFFTPSDYFEDPLEGSLTKKDLEFLNELHPKVKKTVAHHAKNSKSLFGINCWHMNDDESLSMWKTYTEKGNGIVIQSTFDLLKKALSKDSSNIFIGLVEYINHYTEENNTFGNDLVRFFRKDLSFKYEKELRALITNYTLPKKYLVPVDLSILIETIYLSPSMQTWQSESIKSIIQKLYPEIKIKISSLKLNPLY